MKVVIRVLWVIFINKLKVYWDEIIVTRKNDIPIVKISELKDTIIKTTANEIEVEIKDDENVISTSMFMKFRNTPVNATVDNKKDKKRNDIVISFFILYWK